MVQKTDT